MEYLSILDNHFTHVETLNWLPHLSLKYFFMSETNLSNAFSWLETVNKLPNLRKLTIYKLWSSSSSFFLFFLTSILQNNLLMLIFLRMLSLLQYYWNGCVTMPNLFLLTCISSGYLVELVLFPIVTETWALLPILVSLTTDLKEGFRTPLPSYVTWGRCRFITTIWLGNFLCKY